MYTHIYIVLINFKIGCVYIFYVSPAIWLALKTTKHLNGMLMRYMFVLQMCRRL